MTTTCCGHPHEVEKKAPAGMWRSLAEMHVARGVASDWQYFTGDAWPAFRDAFLDRLEEPSESYRCERMCGCGHRVVHHADGSIVAVCECEEWSCDDIPLTAEDVVNYEFNRRRLARAICRALDLEWRELDLGLPWTQQIATFSASAVPVVLSIQQEEFDDLPQVVAELALRWREGFILILPTSRYVDGRVQMLLTQARAKFFDLDTYVKLLPNGTLFAPRRAGELFGAFLPKESVGDESEAKRVFRLFGELLAVGTELTAPPARVFDLIVLQNRNQAETAAACKCARSLITKRVAMIEEVFRLPIEKLRDHASDLKERYATVKGDRYAKRKEGARLEEPQQYAEESRSDEGPGDDWEEEEGAEDD